MPFYKRQGAVPRKRHVAFRKPDGSLYYEELISRQGFSGMYSILYHMSMPTRIGQVGVFTPIEWQSLPKNLDSHRPRHIKTSEVPSEGDFLSARRPLLYNSDLIIYKAHPTQNRPDFYRNGHYDELIYVQSGEGTLETQFGTLTFAHGDFLVIPRGVIWRMNFLFEEERTSILVVESPAPIQTPEKYRNKFGQLLEQSPYCERDIRVPVLQPPITKTGVFPVTVRLESGFQQYVYDHHPFDVVGWDGYHYPWALSIYDFEPIVGSIHQPPPVHQTFEGRGFVICSFVSRPFDFHPEAIPAPYPHSNVDSDEILFYSEGQFMSRSGISRESLTYHPMGLAHGPQPGKYEESIGKKSTEELAVMIDTFRPLQLTHEALQADDPEYALSWIRSTERKKP